MAALGIDGCGRQAVIALAREAIYLYLSSGQIIAEPAPLPSFLADQRALFVSLFVNNKHRGSIGTYLATQANTAQEIIFNAISAAACDPRYERIKLPELSGLSITVDLIRPFEQIFTLEHCDPSRYGVLVQSRSRHGIVLPGNPANAEAQVSLALEKALIDAEEPFDLFRFEVEHCSSGS